MCGIVGYFNLKQDFQFNGSPNRLLESMAAAITHRGPDDSGSWQDAETGIGLAHTRLAIVDLSPAGHQPMRSACDRYVIAFNGEIYNHLALRDQLQAEEKAPAWRGYSLQDK